MRIGAQRIGAGGTPYSAFADKPAGEPIFIVLTGQSNATGYWTPTTNYEINPRVFDWQAPSGDPTNYSFTVADPARTSSYVVSELLVGMRGGNNGHIGWSAANLLQKATGRDVYMLCVAKDGVTLYDEWVWPTGECHEALNDEITPALAAAGMTDVDALIWMQGESDIAGSTPNKYWVNYETMLSNGDAGGWFTPDHTHLVLCDLGDSYVWEGIRHVYQQTNNSSFVNTTGLGESVLHYTGDALTYIGRQAGKNILSGPDSKVITPKTPIDEIIRGQTSGTATLKVVDSYARSCAGEVSILAVNADHDKYYTALVQWRFIRDSSTTHAATATVISETGEAGFATTMTDWFGTALLTVAGTAGETWDWEIRSTYRHIEDT